MIATAPLGMRALPGVRVKEYVRTRRLIDGKSAWLRDVDERPDTDARGDGLDATEEFLGADGSVPVVPVNHRFMGIERLEERCRRVSSEELAMRRPHHAVPRFSMQRQSFRFSSAR
jgi:hypothetical protein